jgi:hypothetical protein
VYPYRVSACTLSSGVHPSSHCCIFFYPIASAFTRTKKKRAFSFKKKKKRREDIVIKHWDWMESFLPIVRFQKVDSLFPNRNIMRNQQRLQIATDIYSKSALLVKFTSCTIWQTSQRYLPKQRQNSGIQHLNCDVIHYSHTQQLLRGYFNFTDNFGTQQPHLWFRIMQIKLGKKYTLQPDNSVNSKNY